MARNTLASRLVALLSLLTALAVIAPGGASSAAPSQFAGVNVQGLFTYLPREAWPRHLNEISASGIRVVRYDASWQAIEPLAPRAGRHFYRWAAYDAVVSALARSGLRWYPVLDYSATWSTSRPPSLLAPPTDDADFAQFARAVAWRYGRGGTFWREHPELPALPVTSYEVWNEQNGGYFWQPGPQPGRYAALFAATTAAIGRQDPSAQVVVGGLVPRRAAAFVAGMLAAQPDLRGRIGAVALHPYARTPQGSAAAVLAFRSALDGLGLADVPIAITEVGWTTRGAGSVPDWVRAWDIAWLTRWAAGCGCRIDRFIPHTWVSRERFGGREDWFGLFHRDGSPTLAGHAYTDAVRQLSQAAGSTR
jgi:polysaccharide biosynthesis protein PslG